MPHSRHRPFKFNAHDRIIINGASYRSVGKDHRTHVLQLVSDDVIENHFITKTDDDIAVLVRNQRFHCDRDFFARTAAKLRARNDTSNLDDCTEEQLRDIYWKKEWCERFNQARLNAKDPTRPSMSLKSMEQFIEIQKDAMDRWYSRRYPDARRKRGRVIKGTGVRKLFDYPSASTLRNWLRRYRKFDERLDAFKTNYHRCGNRSQLDEEVRKVIELCVKQYPARNKPLMCDIYDQVEARLHIMNKNPELRKEYKVSYRTVRRHIHQIAPFVVDAGRNGLDRAKRKYAMVGQGVTPKAPLERVEIDDWEADLFTLLEGTQAWRCMSAMERRKVPRVRCTITAAIDVATRCIVGLNISPNPPSAAGSKTALRRTLTDKNKLKTWAGAKSEWEMYGRPETIVSDGGTAFRGDFSDSLRRLGIDHQIPEKDPRKRGTIESFFRQLKKLCRMFSGQSFANIIEKGDYPAEEMASLTYEEFYKSVIRYIVDQYHNRPHRGLNWRTPASEWERLVKKNGGLAPPLAEKAIATGIGLRFSPTLDNQGILFSNISYSSHELGQLFRYIGTSEVTAIIDQTDLGKVYVRVPDKLLHHFQIQGDYIEVGAVEEGFKAGVTLVDFLATKELLRKAIAADQKKFHSIRLESFARLLEDSQEARKAAGLNDEVFSEENFNKIVKELDHINAAALEIPHYSEEDNSTDFDEDDEGELIAVAKKSRPSEPYAFEATIDDGVPDELREFGESMNSYGDDE